MKYSFVNHLLWVALTIVVLWQSSCSDPTPVGQDLLQGDRSTIEFTDSIRLEGRTLLVDRERFYNGGAVNHRFGRYTDPIFGVMEARLYLGLSLQLDEFGQGLRQVDLRGRTLDSVVLVLPLDSTGVYGPIDQEFGMMVQELSQQINNQLDYFLDLELPTRGATLADKRFLPSFDSTRISPLTVSGVVTDSLRGRHLRVRLSDAYGQRLLAQDTSLYDDLSAFRDSFPGLALQPTRTTAGLLDFAMSQRYAGVYLFYTNPQDTSSNREDVYFFRASAIPAYVHDYSASIVAPFIDAPTADSLLFVQGSNGLMAQIDLANIEQLRGKAINSAELEITVRTLPEDTGDYSLPPRLWLTYRDESEDLSLTNDSELFGSAVLETDPVDGSMVYRFQVALQLQRILDGEVLPTVYIVNQRYSGFGNTRGILFDEQAERVVLYGPGSSRAAKLRVAFSEL